MFRFGVALRAVPRIGVLLLIACGGGDGGTSGPPSEPGPTGSFTMSVGAVSPTAVTQTTSGTVPITISRTGTFTGAVTLAVTNAPAEVTTSLAPAVVAAGSTSSVLTLNVSLFVAAGTYPVTIRATSPGQPDQTATISLAVVRRPPSLSLARTDSTVLTRAAGGIPLTIGLLLTRIEFPGSVSLSVASGLPDGVVASFDPSASTAGSFTATFTVGLTATPGSYTVILRATGSGVADATLPLMLTVTPEARFQLTLAASSITIAQNAGGTLQMLLTRINVSGSALLAVTGLPAGVTGSFSSNPATASSTYTFAVGPAVPPGSYPIVFTATAAGVTGASAPATLIVTPAATGGNTSIRFCGASDATPIWLGFSTSTTWTRVMPDANNTFAFQVPSAARVVWVTQHGADDFRVTMLAATQAEIASFAASQCPSPSNRTAVGTVAGIGATDQAQVVFANRSPLTAITAASPTFTLAGLPDGPSDLLAARSSFDGGLNVFLVNRLFIARALNPANGGSLGTIDFASGSTFDAENANVTVQNVDGGEQLITSSSFLSAGGSTITLGATASGSGLARSFVRVPAARTTAGDFHSVVALASSNANGITRTRSVSQLLANPGTTTLTFPAPPGDPVMDIFSQSGNDTRFLAELPQSGEHNRIWTISWTQEQGSTRRVLTHISTGARVNPAGRRRDPCDHPGSGCGVRLADVVADTRRHSCELDGCGERMEHCRRHQCAKHRRHDHPNGDFRRDPSAATVMRCLSTTRLYSMR